MKIHREVALLLCLCMWIPVALSQRDATADDQETSGDDEFSGSGSGDSEFDDAPVIIQTTRAPLNTTSSSTDSSLVHLAIAVTQPLSTAPPKADPLTPDFGNQAPLHTTYIPKTTSTSTSIVFFTGSLDETTAIQHEADPTTAPAVDTPAGPGSVGFMTTANTKDIREETTVSVFKKEAEAMVPEQGTDKTSETVEEETTPMPTDVDASGDVVETTTLAAFEGNEVEKEVIPVIFSDGNTKNENDLDFGFEDNEIRPKTRAEFPDTNVALGSSSDESLLDKKEVLAGVIAGGVVGLAFAVMLVALMVYRMKKKDEGSYALDEHKHPNGYQKPQRQEEFLA